MLSITLLARISDWIEKLKIYHLDLVNELGEDMIRINMIIKAEKKRVSSGELRSDKFIETAPKEILKEFLRDTKMKYSSIYQLLNDEKPAYADSKLSRTLKSLEKRKKEISFIDVLNNDESKTISLNLERLLIEINIKKQILVDYING